MNTVMIHYVICQLVCVVDPWAHTSLVHSILSLKLGVTVLTDKPEVGRTDAALLVEELTEIYTTSTPKGWHKAKKSNWY